VRFAVVSLLCVGVLLAGCSGSEPPAADRAEKKDGQESRHAEAGVVPGSHEDWCGEHAVPESQCTRCNPELIAAFQATNDWCAEHGLPESQCLACNPDLKIERPPKPEAK
jgi:hypothetical protein